MSRVDPSFVSAFEQLCRDAQVPATRAAAEASLLQLRESDDAVNQAVGVIETSSSSVARFHAAAVLREVVLNRWNLLPQEQRYGPASLRVWAVTVVANNTTMMPFERKSVLGAAAAFFRRAYIEEPAQSQQSFLQLLSDVATRRDSPTSAAVAALELLDMLAEEFLTPKSLKGVEIEIMTRARPQFLKGDGHVVTIFRAALDSLRTTIAITSELDPATLESRCNPALGVLARTLTLSLTKPDFQAPEVSDEANGQSGDMELASVLRLDASWTPLVTQVLEAVQISFNLIDIASSYSQDSEEAQLPNAATQVILAASAISKSSYPSTEMASSLLRHMLSGVEGQHWISSDDSSERVAYAEVWRQVSSSHGLQGLTVFGEEVFKTFANNTCEELRRNSELLLSASQDDLLGIMDITDLLLETWATFAYECSNAGPQVGQVLEPLIGKVFVEYVEMAVRSAHMEKLPAGSVSCGLAEELEEEDMGFDDASAEESRKIAAAALARFSLIEATRVLVGFLENRCEKAFFGQNSATSADSSMASIVQEDVYFLIELIAAVLADSCSGELPSVPDAIMGHMSASTTDTSKVCGHTLFSSLIRASSSETRLLEQKGVHCDEASPRVGRAFLGAFERIARTYLVPSEKPEEAFAVIGGEEFAIQAREYSLTKAMQALQGRFFEPEVAEAASSLLQTLAGGSKKYTDVQTSAVWKELLNSSIESFQRLTPAAVEGIAIALTTVLGDAVAENLVVPASRSLVSLISAQTLLPDAAERCIVSINLLKGVARCQNVGPKSLCALAESMALEGNVARSAIFFQPARFDVMWSAILLADDVLFGRLSLISNEDAQQLLSNAMYLIHQHTVSLLKNGDRIPLEDAVIGIERILQLLQHILDESPPASMAEYLFRGLSSLLPCMSDSFLEYPMIKKSYFDFIAGLVSRYPQPVLSLPFDLCYKILQSLKMELFCQDSSSERRSLQAVGSLAKEFAAKDLLHENTSRMETELAGLLESILTSLARGSAFTDNVAAASETILPLIYLKGPGSQQHFEAIGNKLIAEGGNQSEMVEILNALRDRATAASVWHGFKNQPVPQGSTRPPVIMRRLATKEFKEAVLEFSVRSRDVFLRAATQTAV